MTSADNYGLLVVDIQGKLAQLVNNSDTLISNTIKLIKSCQLLSIPIVVLEQNPKGLGSTTPELQSALNNYQPLEKYYFNGVAETHIKQKIASVNKSHWLVAGIEAHICVYQTVQGLLAENYQVELVSDCISSRKESNIALAIDNMRRLGVNITSVEMGIYQLLQTSKANTFKQILEVIK